MLDRAVSLLRAFSFDHRVMTLAELGRASGLPKSTVHRLVGRLVELELLERHNNGYRVGVSLTAFGATSPVASMRDLATPFLASLHRWSGSTVHFATMRGFDVVYLERITAPGAEDDLTRPGARLPASCTSLGKAMLSWENLDELKGLLPSPLPALTVHSIRSPEILIGQLEQARRTGLALERNETVLGLRSIAVPVVINGYALNAISVTFDDKATTRPGVGAALTDAAARLAQQAHKSLDAGHQAWFPADLDDEHDPLPRSVAAALARQTPKNATAPPDEV